MFTRTKTTLLTSALLMLSSVLSPAAVMASPVLTEKPWLCMLSNDGSSAHFVNVKGKMELCLNLNTNTDGGAQILGVKGLLVNTVTVTTQGSSRDIYLSASAPGNSYFLGPTSIVVGDPLPGQQPTFVETFNIKKLFGTGLSFDDLCITVDNAYGGAPANGKTYILGITVDGLPMTKLNMDTTICPFGK